MTKTEKLTALTRWRDAIEQSNEHLSALSDLMGLYPEGGTYSALHALQTALTVATSELVGDAEGWLDWYRFENDMGRKSYEAGPTDDMRAIKSLDDLIWVIGPSGAATE